MNEKIVSMVSHNNQLFGLSQLGTLYVWNATMYTWDVVQRPTFVTEAASE